MSGAGSGGGAPRGLPDGRVGPYVVQADGAVHRGRSYEGGLRRVEAAGDDALAAPLERRQRRGALVVLAGGGSGASTTQGPAPWLTHTSRLRVHRNPFAHLIGCNFPQTTPARVPTNMNMFSARGILTVFWSSHPASTKTYACISAESR